MLQVLAMIFLRVKITKTRNACGISANSLTLQAFVHALRLCSTLVMRGYLPTDGTGEWLYQAGDIVTLGMCLHLLYSVRETYRHSYQAHLDSCAVWPILAVSVTAAILVHPDLNDALFWDSIWTSALYVDVVAMVPQLWMLSKIGGEVEGLTGHYVALVGLSRIANLIFWYYGYTELAPLDGSVNIPGLAVLMAHVLQSLLMCDFLYYYVRALVGVRLSNVAGFGGAVQSGWRVSI
jgi:hypothetical protein